MQPPSRQEGKCFIACFQKHLGVVRIIYQIIFLIKFVSWAVTIILDERKWKTR